MDDAASFGEERVDHEGDEGLAIARAHAVKVRALPGGSHKASLSSKAEGSPPKLRRGARLTEPAGRCRDRGEAL